MKNIIEEWNKTGKTMQDALKLMGATATAKYTTAIKHASIAGYDITPNMVVAWYIRKVGEKASSPAGAVLYALQHPTDCFDAMVRQDAAVFALKKVEPPKPQKITLANDDTKQRAWASDYWHERFKAADATCKDYVDQIQSLQRETERLKDHRQQLLEAIKHLFCECQNDPDRSTETERAMTHANLAIHSVGGWNT